MTAAALATGIGKVVYVSTVWALEPSGCAPAPSIPKDERWSDDGPYFSAYHGSKAGAMDVIRYPLLFVECELLVVPLTY